MHASLISDESSFRLRWLGKNCRGMLRAFVLFLLAAIILHPSLLVGQNSPQNGRPLLFLPGWCSSPKDWNTLAEEVAGSVGQQSVYANQTLHLVYYDGTSVKLWPSGSDFYVLQPSERFFALVFFGGPSNDFSSSDNPITVAGISVLNKADEVAQVVRAITTLTNLKDVNVIAHSMGGLDARAYLQGMAVPYNNAVCTNTGGYACLNATRTPFGSDIHKLITLDTPHIGAQSANNSALLAYLATAVFSDSFGNCAFAATLTRQELQEHSSLINLLNANPESQLPAGVPIAAITSHSGYDILLAYQGDDIVGTNEQSIATLLPGDPLYFDHDNDDGGNPVECPTSGLTFLHSLNCLDAQPTTAPALESEITNDTLGSYSSIQVHTTLDGAAWSGSVHYSITGYPAHYSANGISTSGASITLTDTGCASPCIFNNTYLPMYSNIPTGEYTLSSVSGGPSTQYTITPDATQTLDVDPATGTNNWSLVFTIAFTGTTTQTLTVNSSNPSSGVGITVTPTDSNGYGNGSTSFTRTYNQNALVTLTAPSTASGNNFSSWTGCDQASATICTVTMTAAKAVTANYTGTSGAVSLIATPHCEDTTTPAIKLTWTPSGITASSYDLYRNGSLYPAGAGLTGTSFDNYGSNVSAGGTYSYYVLAHLNSGGTLNSNTVTATAPTNCSVPAISVTPTSQAYGSVAVGSFEDLSFTVQNTGSGTLSGTASVAAPFSIISGGSYALASEASQTVTVRFSPPATQLYNQNVTFTGGTGATAAVTGTGQNTSQLTISNFTISPSTITSGNTVNLSIALSAAAPMGGATVSLTSSSSTALPVTSPITIPAGQSAVGQSVSTGTVTTSTPVTVTASYNGSSKQATVTVTPLSIAPTNPTVYTGSASAIMTTAAILNGTVNPNGAETYWWFLYGTDSSLSGASSTNDIDGGSGSTASNVSAPITGLSAGTRYYFRVSAGNRLGTGNGDIYSFTTAAGQAPTAATGAASAITTSSATLSGTVNPNSVDTHYWFLYGTNSLLSGASQVPIPAGDLGSGTTVSNVSANIAGLNSGTLYYYQVVASNSLGTNNGAAILNFMTTGTAKPTPTVTVTPSPTSITTAQGLTVTVAVSGGTGNPIPSGTVTLNGGGFTSSATMLNNGNISINIPAGSLATGTYVLTANYSGDSNYGTAMGTSLMVTVAKIATTLGTISTVAGDATQGYSGDNGIATSAELNWPYGVAVDAHGNLYIADEQNQVIRKVSSSGIITTVAGNGYSTSSGAGGYSGDNGPAIWAELNVPYGVAADAFGNIYIADTNNNRIRMVSPNGTITTVAGNGAQGYSGDNAAATSAALNGPRGVAVDGFGNIYIAGGSRIRMVSPSGIITTVAGSGTLGYSGDGAAATSAELNYPGGVAVDAQGNIYIADTDNSRVRMVSPNGIITTVAGNGTPGYSGDNGIATSAELNWPYGVAVDASGNIYIADDQNHLIRKVSPGGIITTVAGDGTRGYSGDNGPAISAELNWPSGVAVDVFGNLYIADTGNSRIREVILSSPPAPTISGLLPSSATAGGVAFTLTINGTTFDSGATALWGSTALKTTYVSANQLTASVPADLITTAGTASVTVTTSGGTSAAATFTIVQPTTQTITFPTPGTQTYGVAPITLMATSSSGLSVSYMVTFGPATVSGSTLTITGAGSVVIQATQAGNSTYEAATPVNVVITVNKAALLVVANNASAAIGTAIPTLQGSLQGVVAGDGITASYSTTAVVGSPVGTYPITPVLSDPNSKLSNYSVTVGSGALVIFNGSLPIPLWMSSSSRTAGEGGFTLTVSGANFAPNSVVLWNGSVRATTFFNSTQLTVVVLGDDLAKEGTALIAVANPAPNAATSAALPFVVISATPVATISGASISNATDGGGNHMLTLTGTDFVSGSTVEWNGVSLVTTYIGPWTITATLPSADFDSAATLTVMNPAGTSAGFELP
jgi:pimeloyl-ACP methyl ester carboxylesterase